MYDTSNLSGHTSFSLNPIRANGLSDLNALQIKELHDKNQRPCPFALYDDSIAFRTHALYASDVMLFNLKFGETGTLGEWLRLGACRT